MPRFGEIDFSQEIEEARPDASVLFTDREDPQEAFIRKLNALTPYMKTVSCVLTFYGIGGVGKTALKNRLCHFLDNEHTGAYYATYDFGDKGLVTDKRNILISLRNQLVLNKLFKFNLFDVAILEYSRKRGVDFRKDETASLILAQNDWINGIVTGLGAVPIVGWISNAVQSLDIFLGKIKDEAEKSRIEANYTSALYEIGRSTPDEILDNLHKYFITDMRENMIGNANKPVVIFLDTYEKYIDVLNSDTLTLIDDYWLRKDQDCVIKRIPGIMWVILGREKITWQDDDPFWGNDEELPHNPYSQMTEEEKQMLAESYLEQHLLGDLSLEDSRKYLKKVNIKDDELINRLYELTKGTPLFLDMCSRQYDVLKRAKKVDISDFGKDLNELIVRYMENMPSYYREMSYLLATLNRWTDEMVKSVVPNVKSLKEFTDARYKDYKKLSFVICEDGSYRIHDSVRKAYLAQTDPNLKNEIESALADYLSSEKISNAESMDFSDNLADYVSAVLSKCDTKEELYSYWDKIKEGLSELEGRGVYREHLSICRLLYNKVKKSFKNTDIGILVTSVYAYSLCLNGKVKEALKVVRDLECSKYLGEISETDFLYKLRNCACILNSNGLYQEALKLDKQCYEARKEILGAEHPDTLKSKNNLGIGYSGIGDHKKALEMYEECYETKKRILGEEHPDTLVSKNNVAGEYSDMGDHKKALEMYEECYEIRKRILGAEHPDTLVSQNNMAGEYRAIGNYKKALELDKECYEIRKKILGENHPSTLNSLNYIKEDSK